MVLAEHTHRGGIWRVPRCSTPAPPSSASIVRICGVLHRSELGLACGATLQTLGQLRAMQSAARMWERWTSAYETGIRALDQLEHGSTRWLRTLSYLFIIAGSLQDQSRCRSCLASSPASNPRAAIRLLHPVCRLRGRHLCFVGMRPMAETAPRFAQELLKGSQAPTSVTGTVLWAESQFHYYLTPDVYRALVASSRPPIVCATPKHCATYAPCKWRWAWRRCGSVTSLPVCRRCATTSCSRSA